MSEINPRPSGPRGRGSSRRGRGGFSSRGGRGGTRQTNGTKPEFADPPINGDEGEIGQLKETYSSKLDTIKEMFPNWTDEDIVFALQETDGDLEGTVERITEGGLPQTQKQRLWLTLLTIIDSQATSLGGVRSRKKPRTVPSQR